MHFRRSRWSPKLCARARWLERVRRVAVPPGACERDRAEAGGRTLGIGVDEAPDRDLCCPLRLHVAMQLGRCVVRAADRTLVARDRSVVTKLSAGVRFAR